MTPKLESPPLALILAAGLGTRLSPLTLELPKPLVPVGDRPLLQALLEKVLELGVAEAWVNAHHQADKIISFCNHLEARVQVSHEPKVLGTAGGARQVARRAGVQRMLLVNGDIWGPLPLPELMAGAGAGLTLAVVNPEGEDEGAGCSEPGVGTVGFDREGRVVRLRGELFGEESASGDYMGLSQLGPECVESLPEEGCLIGDWALPQLRRGRVGRVRAVAVSGRFIDIGSPSAYLEANRAWLRQWGERAARDGGAASSDASASSDAAVSSDAAPSGLLPSYLGAGATLAPGVILRESVVGAGAQIDGEGELRRCVVLPGARCRAPLAESIITPSGAVIGLAASGLAH